MRGLSNGWVRFIVLMEADFTCTGYSYGCCGHRAVFDGVKGAEYFPYKGHSPIDSPLVVEDSIVLERGLDGWKVRVIDNKIRWLDMQRIKGEAYRELKQ